MRKMLVSLIEQRKKHFFLEKITYPISLLYKFIASFRNFLYNASLITPHKTQSVVVSVGNIVAGGVGKTPFVKLIAEALGQSVKVAIILLGYLSKAEKQKGVHFVNLCCKAHSAAASFGDEATMLARKVPHIDVWIAPHKKKGVEEAMLRGAEIAILDDGFQHRKLYRDVDIVILDANSPQGSGYFLPRGPLRESLTQLKRASFIVFTDVQSDAQFEELSQWVKKYSSAKILGTRSRPLVAKTGEKVAILSAIGNPERLRRSLVSLGLDIAYTLFLPDHHHFCQSDLDRFIQEARKKNIEKILCTEKDIVKLEGLFLGEIPWEVIGFEIEVAYHQDYFQDLIAQILEISYDKSRLLK